jgi:GGDEF domain-containing protein
MLRRTSKKARESDIPIREALYHLIQECGAKPELRIPYVKMLDAAPSDISHLPTEVTVTAEPLANDPCQRYRLLTFQSVHINLDPTKREELIEIAGAHIDQLVSRQDVSVGIIFLDVIDFSRFNNEYGQAAGNYVIDIIELTLAELAKHVRRFRIGGGDEFALVAEIPKSDNADASTRLVMQMVLNTFSRLVVLPKQPEDRVNFYCEYIYVTPDQQPRRQRRGITMLDRLSLKAKKKKRKLSDRLLP